jgi:hypothetical protein
MKVFRETTAINDAHTTVLGSELGELLDRLLEELNEYGGFDLSELVHILVIEPALLSNSIKGRTTPDPRRSYPTRTVKGVPSCVKRFRMAARTCNSAT